MNSQKDIKLGGVLLLIGVIIFFITVYFEYQIGWIGSPRSQDPEAVPNFINSHWGELKSIWGWQTFANFLFTLGYFHLAKIKRLLFSIPLGSFWAVLFILGLITLVSFGITLGAYESAASVYDTNPSLFTAIRGGVLGLHGFGGSVGSLIMLIIFLYETLSKNGVVPKTLGFTIIGLLAISFAAIILKFVPGKMIGLVGFLMPLTLGYSYFRYSND